MIQAGWRFTCGHRGCPKTWEKWGGNRPNYEMPPLPIGGLRQDGWVLLYLKGGRAPATRIMGHVVYCPEHGEAAREWFNAALVWAQARRAHMKKTVPTLRERWAAFRDPAAGQPGTLAKSIWDAGQAWEKANPRPVEPWRKCAWCDKNHKPGPENCLRGVLLVCGGRDFSDWATVLETLDKVHARMEIETVRHGKARGADSLGDRWAKLRGINTDPCPADWHQWGKLAGHYRNQLMAEKTPRPVACVAFKGGNGTAGMVAICEATRIPVWRVGW